MAKLNRKNNVDFWMLKANPLLKNRLDFVINERIKNGRSKPKDIIEKKLTYNRLSLAMARDDKLIEDLIMADLKDEKK